MTNPLIQAIQELEDEKRKLEDAIMFLKQRLGRRANGTAPAAPKAPAEERDLFGESDFARLTNEDAVDEILSASNEPLAISEIIEIGQRRGKSLNPNSVRWVLGKGVTDGKYKKARVSDSSAKVYSLK